MILKIPVNIIKKFKIKLLVLFGSYGTEYENKNSDLDLAFLSDKNLEKADEYKLLEELIIFYMFPDIDLVNLRKATPGLKLEIAREGRVIYEKEGEFERFQLYASKVYADTKYLRKERERVFKERVAKL